MKRSDWCDQRGADRDGQVRRHAQDVPVYDLGATAIKLRRAPKVSPEVIDDVILGNCARRATGRTPRARPCEGGLPSRALQHAQHGLPLGHEAVAYAAQAIQLGDPRSSSPAAWTR